MLSRLPAYLKTALRDSRVAEDTTVVEAVELFKNNESEHRVGTDTEEVRGESLPQGHHTLRLDCSAQHIL